MDQKTFLENFGVIADAPGGIEIIRKVIVQAAIGGHLSNLACVSGSEDPAEWSTLTANQVFTSRSGNSKLIKGKLYNEPGHGQFPGFSASGQDVWLDTWEHEGCAAILSAVGARCGKAFLATGKWSAIANTHIIWIPTETILPEFAMLILNNEDFWIRSGTAQPFVKVKATLERTLGIPPLEEQLAILAQVDELMALCDELEAEKAERGRLRTAARASAIDAISTAATHEELSTAWSRISNNWETVADSPESIEGLKLLINDLAIMGALNGHVETEGTSWPSISVGEISEVSYGYTESAKSDEVGPKFLRITDIKESGVKWDSVPYCVISQQDEEKHLLQTGDLVFARTGATTGKSYLLDNPPRAVSASYLIRLRPDRARVLPRYLSLYFQTSKYWIQVKAGTSGTAQGGVNSTKLKEMSLLLPSLSDQELIVAKVDELMALCDELEVNLNLRSEIESAFAHASSQLLSV